MLKIFFFLVVLIACDFVEIFQVFVVEIVEVVVFFAVLGVHVNANGKAKIVLSQKSWSGIFLLVFERVHFSIFIAPSVKVIILTTLTFTNMWTKSIVLIALTIIFETTRFFASAAFFYLRVLAGFSLLFALKSPGIFV